MVHVKMPLHGEGRQSMKVNFFATTAIIGGTLLFSGLLGCMTADSIPRPPRLDEMIHLSNEDIRCRQTECTITTDLSILWDLGERNDPPPQHHQLCRHLTWVRTLEPVFSIAREVVLCDTADNISGEFRAFEHQVVDLVPIDDIAPGSLYSVLDITLVGDESGQHAYFGNCVEQIDDGSSDIVFQYCP